MAAESANWSALSIIGAFSLQNYPALRFSEIIKVALLNGASIRPVTFAGEAHSRNALSTASMGR